MNSEDFLKSKTYEGAAAIVDPWSPSVNTLTDGVRRDIASISNIKQLGSTPIYGAGAPNSAVQDLGVASMKDGNLYFGDKLATGDQVFTWGEANPELATKIGGAQFDAAGNQVGGGFRGSTTDKGPGWGMEGYGGLALGAGQLGLGVLSYLDNEKTAKKNRALVDQQIAANKYVMDKSVKNDAAGTDVYNKVFGDRYGKL